MSTFRFGERKLVAEIALLIREHQQTSVTEYNIFN
jgi:hypothetical protein